MAFWFYRGLRRGIVTTRYPKGPLDPWTRALPTPPAFRPERLTPRLASLLADSCGSGAIQATATELVIDLGRCTGCGRCLAVGGDAVEPSGEFLLATADRRALIKRIPMEGVGEDDGR